MVGGGGGNSTPTCWFSLNNSETVKVVNFDQYLTLTKETKQRQKKLTMASCWQIGMSLSFFLFMANLEQFGTRIPDA